MDCKRTGALIYKLRKEKGLTQKALADFMNISDKAISKWERGLGCPDVSLLSELSYHLGINIGEILSGEITPNDFVGGNMKKSQYYVCPLCGNVTVCTGNAEVSCCGRRLEALIPQKADETHALNTEQIEDEIYITGEHPMVKDHYISFIALATGERIQLIKQYPEWNLQTRIPRGHGMLLWYCTNHGLFYKNI